MKRILIIAPEAPGKRLAAELGRFGFVSTVSFLPSDLDAPADGVLLGGAEDERLEELCRHYKNERRLPVIALLKRLVQAASFSCTP